jgi:hypothetical protein
VVASGADRQPATIEHGVTGWIVPPCEQEPLAQALIHLATHPDLRVRLGRAARQAAEQSHTWERTARQLMEVFEHVLQA